MYFSYILHQFLIIFDKYINKNILKIYILENYLKFLFYFLYYLLLYCLFHQLLCIHNVFYIPFHICLNSMFLIYQLQNLNNHHNKYLFITLKTIFFRTFFISTIIYTYPKYFIKSFFFHCIPFS